MATTSFQISTNVREKAVVERWFFTGFVLAAQRVIPEAWYFARNALVGRGRRRFRTFPTALDPV